MWHNQGMKWIITAISAVLVIVVAMIVAICALNPGWKGFTNDSTYGDGEFNGLDEYDGLSVGYRQKYNEAVAMLDVNGISELGDYLIVVDVSEQKEYVYTGEGSFIDVYKISTGTNSVFVGNHEESEEDSGEEEEKSEYEDRTMGPSVWRVVSKRESGMAPLYGARLMMLDRFVGGNWIRTEVALHGTNTPEILGTPESLGCVYHDNVDIIALYDLIAIGTYVVAIE